MVPGLGLARSVRGVRQATAALSNCRPTHLPNVYPASALRLTLIPSLVTPLLWLHRLHPVSPARRQFQKTRCRRCRPRQSSRSCSVTSTMPPRGGYGQEQKRRTWQRALRWWISPRCAYVLCLHLGSASNEMPRSIQPSNSLNTSKPSTTSSRTR